MARARGPRFVALIACFALSVSLVDCIDTRTGERAADAGPPPPGPCDELVEPVPVEASVSIELEAVRATVPPFAYGMHASVYDNALHHPELTPLLHQAGIALLRWPGGGYAEMYHWSNHTLSPTFDGDDEDDEPDVGWLADRSDFGHFVGIVEDFGGAMMITVNYGSNLQADGPGEPKEAAAWVAYANGEPDDERVIGVDGAGNDWLTVGYWASLRASPPLPEDEDDGLNHLRIEHREPLGIEYWEIGNEVFGNGWNERTGWGFAFDLHVPYDEKSRYRHELLSGVTYGAGVVAYHDEMKAVDPTIKIGAVLGTPPGDDSWGVTWNDDVLGQCASVIDFGIVHWYPNPSPPAGRSPLPALLGMPQNTIPVMESRLRASFAEHAGERADDIELVMTEVGPGNAPNAAARATGAANRSQAVGLFALDTYLTLIEHGFVNVDWLELHNGSFLNEASLDEMHRKGPAFMGIQMAHLLAAPGDELVTATSDVSTLVVHAARRGDGTLGVLLANTDAPELARANVTLSFTGGSVGPSGERWDYFAAPSQAPVPPPDAGVDGSVDAGITECRVLNGANGTVTGPTPFSFPDTAAPFVVEVPPYGVSLLVFEAPE